MSLLSSCFTVVSQTLGRQGRNGSAPALNAHVPCEACQTPSPRGVISQINVYSVLRHKEEVGKPQVGGGGVGVFLFRRWCWPCFLMLLAQSQSCEEMTLSLVVILVPASSLCRLWARLCAFLCLGFPFSTGESGVPELPWKRNPYSFCGQQTQDRVCAGNACACSGERVQFVANIALPSPFYLFTIF